jgi:hypothetical protein
MDTGGLRDFDDFFSKNALSLGDKYRRSNLIVQQSNRFLRLTIL